MSHFLKTSSVISLAFMATLLTLALGGCSTNNPQLENQSTTQTPEAGLFSKDTNLCIQKGSSSHITISWDTRGRAGINSTQGEGKLLPGAQLCGEGSRVPVKVTFPSGFATVVEAQNPSIGYPIVAFYSGDHFSYYSGDKLVITGVEYASAYYSEGETVNSNVEGHHITTLRLPNTDWVNFRVTIKY